MKRNKLEILCLVLLTVCFLFVAYESVFSHTHWNQYPGDLTFRYNEILCAHGGVDPFDIFERKVVSDEFCGIRRPDMPLEPTNGRKEVHTYPATQMALFWWYGYFSLRVVTIIINLLNLCVLAWVFLWTSKHYRRSDTISLVQDILFILCLLLFPFSIICETLNYGLLLLGAMLFLYTLLQTKHDILAGVVYAFIMIKPQIGIVLFLPLFFGKWYRTIAVAGAICIAETLFIAWKLDKSPIEIILQIPQMGAPFYKGVITNATVMLIGPIGQYLVMGVFFLIAMVGCFLVRNAEDVWVRFIPALAIIPFWTYSSKHDWLILLPLFLFILNNKQNYPRIYDVCSWLVILWCISFFAPSHGMFLWAHNKLDTAFYLAIVASSFIQVVLNNREQWCCRSNFHDLMFWKKDK